MGEKKTVRDLVANKREGITDLIRETVDGLMEAGFMSVDDVRLLLIEIQNLATDEARYEVWISQRKMFAWTPAGQYKNLLGAEKRAARALEMGASGVRIDKLFRRNIYKEERP